MSTTDHTEPPLLTARGISKRFGRVQAVADVDLTLCAGEVHAILGENGAGKSTLMNILGGVYRPDGGRLTLDGSPVSFTSPRAARDAGIGMVHQHFTLVEALTVAENLALSLPGAKRWRYQPRPVVAQATALAARVGLDLSPPEATVSTLPVGARQRLEILKALAHAAHVLILDEPTAVLTPQEVGQLFALLSALRTQGRAIIFITHKLREVMAIADRVTVMRRGRVVGTYATADTSESALAEAMIGAVHLPPPQRQRSAAREAVRLRVEQLTAGDGDGVPGLQDVSFSVRAGEVFGIAGVDGNGQQELFRTLVGVLTPRSGTVCIDDQPLRRFTPQSALAAGIGHIPPDRQREGLVLSLSIYENILLSRPILDRFTRYGILQRAAARRFAADAAQRYDIRLASLDVPVSSLSGGNQQRVVVARALAHEPLVLVAVNPTRGLDVAAARAVSVALLAIADRGGALVLISTDLDEVLELSDRVGVLARGRLSPALEPPIDAERLGLLMAGVTS